MLANVSAYLDSTAVYSANVLSVKRKGNYGMFRFMVSIPAW